MCAECWRDPCHPRCPNAPEVVAAQCTVCGGDIYVGDTAYQIDGDLWCEECITDCRTEARVADDGS